ncbi:MAG: TlpA disulfide reductase family protein [Rhodospirillaceae bacterium]|nr:TlpA disulfide reductase family protein [Rhodospirillaceae bacterium]
MDQPRSPKGLIAAAVAVGGVLIIAVAMLASGGPAAPPVANPGAPPAPPSAPGPQAAAPPAAANPAAKLVWHEVREPVAATVFQGRDGTGRTLADFAGQVLVVNFWATWCAPCIKEMPTLKALHERLGGPDFQVLAISQDREGMTVAAPFMETNGWTALPLFAEPDARFARDAKLRGLPTTIVVDRQGREAARLEGTIEWDAPEVVAALQRLIDEPAR